MDWIDESLPVEGMHCTSCAARIEGALNALPSVEAGVNVSTNSVSVRYQPSITPYETLVSTIQSLGYEVPLPGDTEILSQKRETWLILRMTCALLCSLPFFLDMLHMWISFPWNFPPWIQLFLATLVQGFCAWPFYSSSWRVLKGGGMSMDLLVVLGTSAAYGMSVGTLFLTPNAPLYFESAVVIVAFVLLGRFLEGRAKKKTSSAITSLMRLQPQKAFVLQNGEFVELPVEKVKVGDVFLIRPGEKVAVDGRVLKGSSSIDESLLTGESSPVKKEEEDLVYAGTVNGEGTLRVESQRIGHSTILASIIRLVHRAQSSKAPIQRFADRVAGVFIPSVLFIAFCTALYWGAWRGLFVDALLNAVSVLVVACPCALGLATPTVISVAIGKAARKGILIREAQVLELAPQIQAVFLDKTGTLTKGSPQVQSIFSVKEGKEKDVLRWAAALEEGSEHPLAKAITQEARERGLKWEACEAMQSTQGLGVQGRVEGQSIVVGSKEFLKSLSIPFSFDSDEIFVAVNGEVLGFITVRDQLRDDSKEAIKQLKYRGLELTMLTGDQQAVADEIALELGLESYRARVLPQDKIRAIRDEQSTGSLVGMVGDGVNDAPALAAADVGMAMGGGSGVAIESAPVTLLGRGLGGVVDFLDLSRLTMRKVRQNLFLALIYNTLCIPMAAMGWLSPMIAGGAMALSSLSVVTNALLLKVSVDHR